MLHFDPVARRITQGRNSVELPGLSYSLLSVLHANANSVVSSERLVKEVWRGTVISPDTLKQRVFLLRKALADEGFEFEITGYRGEGYQLTISEQKAKTLTVTRPLAWAAFAVTIVLASFIFHASDLVNYSVPSNNRVVFWDERQNNSQAINSSAVGDAVESTLLSESNHGLIQYVRQKRDSSIPFKRQARQARAALVVIIIEHIQNGNRLIRLQTIEPHTEVVLRDDIVNSNNPQPIVEAHINAVKRLVLSEKLTLTKQMKNDAMHPRWKELHAIANRD